MKEMADSEQGTLSLTREELEHLRTRVFSRRGRGGTYRQVELAK